jgi:DHA1 family bicyclomycin/chloramphenicol resistance-like MFS transporter
MRTILKYKIDKNSKMLLGILATLMALTSLSTDAYLPAMPKMQVELHGNIELTITGFLIGFAIAQLFWGPISDRFGRLIPLILGILIFILGSIGCALSNNITQILFWRMVQAIGACTGPMLSRAMIRDLYSSNKAAEMLSTLTIIMAIAPIVGPVLGGQLLKIWSWHSIFWTLVFIGFVLFIAIRFMPETLPAKKRTGTSIASAFGKYKVLISHRKFMTYTLSVTFYYVAAYAFITGSPKIYISCFGVDPQYYGWLFAINIVGVMTLSFINRKLVRRFQLNKLLRTSTAIAMLAGLVLVVSSKFNTIGILGIIIPVFFFFSMNGIIAATSTAAALEDVPEMVGAASALLGSLQYGSGILSSLLLAIFSDGTPWTMCWIIAVFSTASTLMVNLKPIQSRILAIKFVN